MQQHRRDIQEEKTIIKFWGRRTPSCFTSVRRAQSSLDCFLKSGEEIQDLICSYRGLFPSVPADMQGHLSWRPTFKVVKHWFLPQKRHHFSGSQGLGLRAQEWFFYASSCTYADPSDPVLHSWRKFSFTVVEASFFPFPPAAPSQLLPFRVPIGTVWFLSFSEFFWEDSNLYRHCSVLTLQIQLIWSTMRSNQICKSKNNKSK